jgi:APA family basic amino acid/polyamine antiporter
LIRSLSLTHAVLYGLGVTIGAGIYVLVGVAVAGLVSSLLLLAFALID